MAEPKLIYLGIKGSVLALNPANGNPVWQQKLKGSDFVNIALDGDRVFAATRGEMFCLDARTGSVRWHNPLTGYGWGLVSLAGDGINANPLSAMAEKRRQDAASDASASNSSTS